jgi:hypothetical protein
VACALAARMRRTRAENESLALFATPKRRTNAC